MFTRVSDWFGLLAAILVIGGVVLAVSNASGETIAYAAAFAMLFLPRLIIKGALSTFNEDRQETIRMNARERRYGKPKGTSWQHGY